MAKLPWHVYVGKLCVAQTLEVEAAAALISGIYGSQSPVIKWGALTVWVEGKDGVAGDSYDTVAETANGRVHEAQRVPCKVGDGGTVHLFTDRHACTVAFVSPKSIVVREDKATLISGQILSESQVYEYEPNPAGTVWVFVKDKYGRWVTRDRGAMLSLGWRNEYRDPSF